VTTVAAEACEITNGARAAYAQKLELKATIMKESIKTVRSGILKRAAELQRPLVRACLYTYDINWRMLRQAAMWLQAIAACSAISTEIAALKGSSGKI